MTNAPRFHPRFQLALAVTTALVAQTAPGLASSEPWRVVRLSGTTWTTAMSGQRYAMAAGQAVELGDTIVTGPGGRVMLARGTESMVVGPSSVVAISDRPAEGLSTTVIEKTGSVTFDVEKRNVQHFSVETPMLAAVVKGTHFTVTVGRGDGSVKVGRGTVQVTALATGQTADVTVGQRAGVGRSGLTISGSGRLGAVTMGQPRPAVVGPVTAVTPATVVGQDEVAAIASIPATVGASDATDTQTSVPSTSKGYANDTNTHTNGMGQTSTASGTTESRSAARPASMAVSAPAASAPASATANVNANSNAGASTTGTPSTGGTGTATAGPSANASGAGSTGTSAGTSSPGGSPGAGNASGASSGSNGNHGTGSHGNHGDHGNHGNGDNGNHNGQNGNNNGNHNGSGASGNGNSNNGNTGSNGGANNGHGNGNGNGSGNGHGNGNGHGDH